MTTRPILLSDHMIRSLLASKKRMTRWIMKPQPPESIGEIRCGYFLPATVDRHGDAQPGPEAFGAFDLDGEWGLRCPYGAPGDALWCMETFGFDDGRLVFRADDPDANVKRWSPSIVMPRALSRLTLTIEAIRVERLRTITEEDARAAQLKAYGNAVVPPVAFVVGKVLLALAAGAA